MEMSREQLVQRMICSEARVDAHKLRTGFLQDDDWDRLAGAIQRLWDANIYIDDTTDMGPLEMRAKCRRLRAEQGLDLVIVDYLQLMRGSGDRTPTATRRLPRFRAA
jgi:replicative DNA helicase